MYRNPAGVTALGHTPLCEFGHQGLMHDDRIGLKENSARVYHPRLGRWVQRDPHPAIYPDGMNAYAAYHVLFGGVDPFGHQLIAVSRAPKARPGPSPSPGPGPSLRLLMTTKLEDEVRYLMKAPIVAEYSKFIWLIEHWLIQMMHSYPHSSRPLPGTVNAFFDVGSGEFVWNSPAKAIIHDIVIEEAIHALDYSRSWYLVPDNSGTVSKSQQRSAERLVGGALVIHDTITRLHFVERQIIKGIADSDLRDLWHDRWTSVAASWNSVPKNTGSRTELPTEAWLVDAFFKLRVRMSCTGLGKALSENYKRDMRCFVCPKGLPAPLD